MKIYLKQKLHIFYQKNQPCNKKRKLMKKKILNLNFQHKKNIQKIKCQ